MTKREMAFVLSLVATAILPVFLGSIRIFVWFIWRLMRGSLAVMPGGTYDLIKLTILILIMLIMITGLLFMGISKTKKGRIIGGVIILSVGIILGIERNFLLIPAVMAIVGGCLGIQGAEDEIKERQYLKALIISIVGFIYAFASVFIFISYCLGWGAPSAGAFIAISSYWIIPIILNAISTVIIKRKESIPQKRTKTLMTILITVTWCLIALSSSFLLLFLLHLAF